MFFRFLEHLEDLKLAGNLIVENDQPPSELMVADDSTICDNSTSLPANPSISISASTSASTAKLLRKSSSSGGSKAALDDGHSRCNNSSGRVVGAGKKAKYAGMSLEKALSLACPALQTLDGESMAKKREKEAKHDDHDGDDDGGFHTW
jgi:hypothetical protein